MSRRIAIVGPVASGKSTLARHLGSELGLPVVDLDDVYFSYPGRLSDIEWRKVHRRLLEPDKWIIAGDYRAVADDRFAAADVVIWLDLSRPVCWWRAWLRRNSVPKLACVRWIWRYPSHGRQQTLTSLERHSRTTTIYRLRSRRDVRRFMANAGRLITDAFQDGA